MLLGYVILLLATHTELPSHVIERKWYNVIRAIFFPLFTTLSNTGYTNSYQAVWPDLSAVVASSISHTKRRGSHCDAGGQRVMDRRVIDITSKAYNDPVTVK